MIMVGGIVKLIYLFVWFMQEFGNFKVEGFDVELLLQLVGVDVENELFVGVV